MKRSTAALLVLLLLASVRSEPQAESVRIGTARVVTSGPSVAQPHAAFGDGVYLVVWQDGWTGVEATADIKGMRFKAGTLELLDKEPINICAAADAQEAPVVAFADGAFLVAWQDFRNGKDFDVRGLLIDAKTGRSRGDEIEIAVRPSSQSRPAVASVGKTLFAVWQEVRGDVHGICGTRVAVGKVLDAKPHNYADAGSSPAVAVSAGKVLVAWAMKGRTSGRTAVALVDPATGAKVKDLGIINTCYGDRPAVAHDGKDGFRTVAGRASAPAPWGWGGPGALVLSRVRADGTTPESKLNYAYRLSNLCSRSVPNVVDAAVWKGAKTWNAGAVGGFQGTKDGLSNLDIWLRGMDAKTLEVRVADRKAAASEADETRPVLVNGPAGEILPLYERLQSGAPRSIEARRIGTTD